MLASIGRSSRSLIGRNLYVLKNNARLTPVAQTWAVAVDPSVSRLPSNLSFASAAKGKKPVQWKGIEFQTVPKSTKPTTSSSKKAAASQSTDSTKAALIVPESSESDARDAINIADRIVTPTVVGSMPAFWAFSAYGGNVLESSVCPSIFFGALGTAIVTDQANELFKVIRDKRRFGIPISMTQQDVLRAVGASALGMASLGYGLSTLPSESLSAMYGVLPLVVAYPVISSLTPTSALTRALILPYWVYAGYAAAIGADVTDFSPAAAFYLSGIMWSLSTDLIREKAREIAQTVGSKVTQWRSINFPRFITNNRVGRWFTIFAFLFPTNFLMGGYEAKVGPLFYGLSVIPSVALTGVLPFLFMGSIRAQNGKGLANLYRWAPIFGIFGLAGLMLNQHYPTVADIVQIFSG